MFSSCFSLHKFPEAACQGVERQDPVSSGPWPAGSQGAAGHPVLQVPPGVTGQHWGRSRFYLASQQNL